MMTDRSFQTSPTAQRRASGYGLGLFHPPLRLFLTVALSFACSIVQSSTAAAVLFTLGILFIVLNGRIAYPRLFTAVMVSTVFWLLIGNALFSPLEGDGLKYWIFRLNWLGIEIGTTAALKRAAMIAIGFAFLFSTSIPELFEAIAFFSFKGSRKWVLRFFRGIQTLGTQVQLSRYSLLVRGLRPGFFRPRSTVLFAMLSLQSLIGRFFEHVGKATFAGETHHLVEHPSDGSITVSRLSVSYDEGSSFALRDVTFSLVTGDFIYLGGRNGSGKTTLLRALCGYVPRITGDFAGEVLVGGMSIDGISLATLANRVRYISQDPAESIVGLTVGQEISALSTDAATARSCLEAMGILHLWERETISLSGGEQVRLVLAGVLASNVAIILLDSPLEQLDRDGRRSFIDALLQFSEVALHSPTIVVADPLFEEFAPYIDRSLWLEAGKLVEDIRAPLSANNLATLVDRFGLATTDGMWLRPLPTSGDPLASLQNVSVTIGNTEVITDVNLTVTDGSCTAVTGANGSGKTTAMLALAGLLKPTYGRVWSRESLSIGYVFQDAALQLVAQSVRSELGLGPRFKGWSKERIDTHVDEQLAWIRLDPNSSPIDLHPASKKLLALSAMNVDVNLMILDEPSLGLDAGSLDLLIGWIYALLEKRVAVLIVTHDRRLLQVASRVVTFEAGRIASERQGGLTEIGSHPLQTTEGVFALGGFEYGERDELIVTLRTQTEVTDQPWALRIQYACLYGNAFGSLDCDCDLQLRRSLQLVQDSPPGLVIYVPGLEGRGHGLGGKLRMLTLEREFRLPPLETSRRSGLRHEDYNLLGAVPFILRRYDIRGPIRLITNSPQKLLLTRALGIPVGSIINLEIDDSSLSSVAREELTEKTERLGHSHSPRWQVGCSK